MPLPTIVTPSYELELPSTGKKIKYRPFLVKEEKLLVIALESEDTKQITTAIKAVIKACIKTRGVKVEALPTFDIEYLFLNIRGKSVGEDLEVNIICPDDKDEISEWKRMENWLKNHKEMETMIGLGGNIRSFLNTHNSKKMKSDSFYKKFKKLNELNTKDKIEKYGFAEDRADIIGFALQIYEKIIKQLGIKTIKSTKWGVSDSIAVKTLHEIYSDKISIYEDR